MRWLVLVLGLLIVLALWPVFCRPQRRAWRLNVEATPVPDEDEGEGIMITTKLQKVQHLRIVCRPVDPTGARRAIDGTIALDSDNLLVVGSATFERVDEEDGPAYVATVVPGEIGTATLKLTADGDLGEGVEIIEEEIEVIVEDARATKLGITVEAISPES
jgi:hypothetical protein